MLRDRDEAVFRCVHRLDKTRAASLGISSFESNRDRKSTQLSHPILSSQRKQSPRISLLTP